MIWSLYSFYKKCLFKLVSYFRRDFLMYKKISEFNKGMKREE